MADFLAFYLYHAVDVVLVGVVVDVFHLWGRGLLCGNKIIYEWVICLNIGRVV